MTPLPKVLAIGAIAIGLAACGGGDDSPGVSDATSSTSTAATESTAAATGAVDANEASVDELTAAFEAAGIPNASRWAREVEEYRPYPTDDPSFAKLRQELSKYNPSDEVLDQILAALSL